MHKKMTAVLDAGCRFGRVMERIVQPVAALFRRYHVMTYVVAGRA